MPRKVKVFLDMDGIICDFHNEAMKFHRVPSMVFRERDWDTVGQMCAVLGITESQFWGRLPFEFWSEMAPTDDANRIWHLVHMYFNSDEIQILSTPHCEVSAFGKIAWIKRYIPSYSKQYILTKASKGCCAKEGRLLIDDGDHNINDFVAEGGSGILFPRFWNSNSHRQTERFEILESGIKDFVAKYQ